MKILDQLIDDLLFLRVRLVMCEIVRLNLDGEFQVWDCSFKNPTTHNYSTVTDLAKFRGWSTSVPFNKAT